MSIKSLLKNNKEIPKLFSVVVDQGFMSISTLLTTIVLARTYSKASYADLVLLFSTTIFILGFQSGIISKPYAINFNDFTAPKRNEYFLFNLHLKFYFTILVGLVFPLLYFIFFEVWDSTLVFVFDIYIISNISYYFVRETLLSERKTKQNLIYGLTCSIGLIILLGFIYFSKTISIVNYLIIASSIYGILTTLFIVNYFITNNTTLKEYKKFTSLNWSIGKWLLGSNIFFFLSSSIYPWLLLFITNKKDIATFGVLVSVSSIVNPLLLALSSYILPLFVKNNSKPEKVNLMVKKWTVLFGVLSILLIIIGYFYGQSIINILFGEKYINLGILVFYPFLIQSMNVLFQPMRISLNAIKRTDVNFWVLIPRSLTAVMLGYFLIGKYGLSGAFYTMLIENFLYQFLYLIMYNIIMKKQLLEYKSS